MFRGITTFVCDKCGHKFKGLDVEWNATIFSAPQRCPNCGSFHTSPGGGGLFRYFYKRIWASMDKQMERRQAQAKTSENNQ